MTAQQKIAPCLWFDKQALEAAEFYVSAFPDSRIDNVIRSGVDWPAGEAGDVIFVEFTLSGVAHQALNGGANQPFTEAISLSVTCEDQAEIDRLWAALTDGGGEPIQCGWLKDRFGLRWQIVPASHQRMMREGNDEQLARLMAAMMNMVKFDVAALEAVFEGKEK
ncbi:VOC family protein [Pararhizobium sp. IMCC21322]|uniref:VOC family protein n=1 Tax=Pararhizobium sp. IMCC21322 TaxID=3067903 RepID=UPI002741D967|nr:VOC family protein [Pararhizobium sp. IMCC21322]